jgi:lipoprotein-anchoring transpeptidase ErfK/SrfK
MKFEYRPYREKNGSSPKTKIILLVLALIIVGLVALNQWKKKQAALAEMEPETPEAASATVSMPEPEPQPNLRSTSVNTTAERLDMAAGSSQPVAAPVAQPTVTTSVQAPATAVPPTTVAETVNVVAVPTPTAAVDTITSPEAASLIRQSVQDIADGKVIAARDQLNKVLDMKLSDAVRDEVKKQLTKLSETWLFSKQVYPGDTLTEVYKVQPGDVLAIFARKYKVPHEAIEKINGITNPERLQAGQTLKVIHGPFSVVVSKKDFTLDLYLQGVFVKQYKVGLGRVEHETPTGKWIAARGGKMIKPTWTDPDTGRIYQGSDPDYPLGSRWIALDGVEGAAKGRTGFAIHGTKDPESIGTRASRGCVRLFNGDVVEVYDLLEAGISEILLTE